MNFLAFSTVKFHKICQTGNKDFTVEPLLSGHLFSGHPLLSGQLFKVPKLLSAKLR